MSYGSFDNPNVNLEGKLLTAAQDFDQEIHAQSHDRNLFAPGMSVPSLGDPLKNPPQVTPEMMVPDPFKPLTGFQTKDIPSEAFGWVPEVSNLDAGIVSGKHDNSFNNEPVTAIFPMNLGFRLYAAGNASASAATLLNFLTTGSPIFCVTDVTLGDSDANLYANLAHVNEMLSVVSPSEKVDQIKNRFKFAGYLQSIIDKRDWKNSTEVLGEFIVHGECPAIHLWSQCHIRPRQACFLHLIIVQRVRGFEREEEKAYQERTVLDFCKQTSKMLRPTQSIAAAEDRDPQDSKAATYRNKRRRIEDNEPEEGGSKSKSKSKKSKKSCQKDRTFWRHLTPHRRWVILPHVSIGPSPDPYWLRGPGWQGGYYTIGIDYGHGVRASNSSEHSDRSMRYVEGASETEMGSELCAKTTIHIDRGLEIL